MKIGIVSTPKGLATCHAIRRAVFIDEQGISEADEWDDLDPTSTHFLAHDDAGPAATARLYPQDKAARIGRVAVALDRRGTGVGLSLMRAVLGHARRAGFTSAIVEAQTYAVPFYERMGFVVEGPEFDDAGIPHRRMTLAFQPAKSPA